MSALDCIKCSNHFNSYVNLPRILQCGHTICTQCLSNILTESKLCPSCRKETTIDKVYDYPVNYIAKELSDPKNELGLQYTKENFIQTNQEKVKSLQEENLELRTAVELSLELIKSNDEQLNFLSKSVVSDPSPSEPRRKIMKVEERFDSIYNQINIFNSPLIKEVSVKSKDFGCVDDFLQEIHKVIMVEGKMMAAVLRIKGVKQFAKLSIRDDLLFIHSFERYQEKYHDVITVCLQDLRAVLLRNGKTDSIFGFLDLTYNANKFSRRVIIELKLCNPCLGSQFLKLCTGELGISYKGLKYEQLYDQQRTVGNVPTSTFLEDSIIKVKGNKWDIENIDCYSTFFLKKRNNKVSCTSGRIYVARVGNWSFNIFKLSYKGVVLQSPNIIGTVIDLNKDFATTFKDASFREIIDCGMAVKI